MTFSVSQPVVVVDASIAVEAVRPDPAWSARIGEWLELGAMLLVPRQFPFELANALLRSVRLPATDVVARLDHVERLGVETADLGPAGLRAAIELADRHGLSVYDSAYLELAIDTDATLATLDSDLRAAAVAEGVPLAEGVPPADQAV